ncbi:MAG: 4-hydroxybenzoyl-CoA reductase subunit beta [Planctomycetes bacterium]|nr:4-hydroxybenzoyl-CoA reductase subunit beta [Planctomycetota bacterium]
MLRMPQFSLERPRSLAQAIALLSEHGPAALPIAGGTDLVPNLKHELHSPSVLVALEHVPELHGVRVLADGALSIGAMTRLADLALHPEVVARAPALAQAASLVAGPQLRTMGTLGGNVLLDTRCQWINQSYFWRQALGFCLKKDGTVCHVVEGGKKCVAAASNDTAPALMTLGATLELEGPDGVREIALDEFWVADGINNKKLGQGELLVRIRVPQQRAGHRGAYGKLRERGSIDFPMLGVAVRVDIADERIRDADLCVVALAARPLRVKRVGETLAGKPAQGPELETAIEAVAELAHKQCHPLPNIPGDADWRKEMVPVYVRRTLLAALTGSGPVHHV